MIIKVALVKEEKSEIFDYEVTNYNYKLVKGALELEVRRIIDKLHDLKDEGKIKTLSRPRNKKIQDYLNQLMSCKRILYDSINKIKQIYT